jgi:hypothetical protein
LQVAAGLQYTQRLDHAIASFGRDGPYLGQSCVSGIFSVDRIVFASLAAIMLIRCRHFQYGHASLLKVTKQTSAIGSRAFHANASKFTKRTEPCQHLLIPMTRTWETLVAQNVILVINHCCEMQLLVGIHATNHNPLLIHGPPLLEVEVSDFATTNTWTRQ